MRVTLFAAAVAMMATPAMAQGSVGTSLGDLHAAHEVLQKRAQTTSMLEAPGSPFSQLSKANRTWIREETKRQAATPRPLVDVLVDVDETLAEDAQDLSRKYRIDPMDVTRVVILLIMADAEAYAAKAVKKAKKAGDPDALEAARARLVEATQRRKDAVALQTTVSMQLATM